MSRKKSTNKFLGRWHSRIGILSAVFVLLLALTGLVINHAHDLGLDKKPVQNSSILALYGVKLPPLRGVLVEKHWLIWQGRDLYLGGEQLVECNGAFVGAITLPNYWVAACERDLFVFTYEQELLERVGQAVGMTYPLAQIGACEALLCYQVGKKIFQMDIETLQIKPFAGAEGHALQWSAPDTPPAAEAAKVRKQTHGGDLTWERVVLDLHAGRFFGRFGPWIMDAVAVLFIFLAVSGLVIWSRHKGGASRKRS